ncbi:MAG: hypothetical protein IT204_19425 [Fimbriimonadaceae bacterium]|nr:hypothetical protein [Fimbriimonadaceae bacterium]
MKRVERALLSVYDKTGLLPFARDLAAVGITLVSTGGTARALREGGLEVVDVATVTGFPEMMDGRVKTLHPRVHGALLARRDEFNHLAAAAAHGIELIDLVVVNLYPFEQTIAQPGVTPDEAIEQIDIGGPAMLRSAAKNHAAVTVVCDPSDYDVVLAELRANGNETTLATRQALARKVYETTSRYDRAIADWLAKQA